VARGKTVEVNGPLSPARPTLVQYGVTSVSRGQQLIARGFNYWGCFDVILVKAGQFLTVPVVDPGPFDVTIEVPEPGKYTPVIGGGACNGWNRFTIAEIGWRTVP
jgi:hypothetical protein